MIVYRSPLPDIYVPKANCVAHYFESPHLAQFPNTVVMLDSYTGEQLTASELHTAARRYMALLARRYRVVKGDVVSIFTGNSIYLQPVHFGIVGLGGIICPANANYTVSELAYQLKTTSTKLIVCTVKNISITRRAIAEAGTKTRVLTLEQAISDIKRLLADESALEFDPVQLNDRIHPAYLCFSSGTTGLPKAVQITHRNLNAQIRQLAGTGGRLFQCRTRTVSLLPFSHSYGLVSYLWAMPYLAQTMVVFDGFDFEHLLKSICEYDVGYFAAVPPMVLMLAKSPLVDKYPVGKHLKVVVSGAAPLAASTLKLCRERLPEVVFNQTYGLTEVSPYSHMVGYMSRHMYNNSIGWLIPNMRARLVDPETLTDVPPGQPGELWLRGPNVMLGYYKNPEANNATFHEGWLRTGDVARIDETGQYFIVDRLKELIKSKGHQVAPAELEGILLTHEHVIEAAVIGVLDETETTENPRAFLVLRPEADVEQILSWFNSLVSKHKRLWGGIVIVDQIPKSVSGKIIRRTLRARKNDTVYTPVDAKL